jgi:hypothetical protein
MAEFYARHGSRISHQDAQIIGAFISQHFADNPPSTEELLDSAKPKDSPIHHLFEWDDKVAANEHRLHTARVLIRSIVVRVEGNELPAFCNITISDEGPRRYMATTEAVKIPSIWDQVLRRALKEAADWSLRYEKLHQLNPIREQIGITLKELNYEEKTN